MARNRAFASAALDVSDGLTGDLGHILEASRVGARIDVAQIPCADPLRAKLGGDERELALSALLAGGDDYELCFTAPPTRRGAIERLATTPVARIGRIVEGTGVAALDAHGAAWQPRRAGYRHFA